MAKNYILRIDHDGNPVCLYTYDAQNQVCTTTAVKQWSDGALKQQNLLLLVPATWVYHSQTQVSSKNMELLTKSIPFAIEEELSNEVEENYFAFQLNEDGSQSVVAIEKDHLNQLNKTIEQSGLGVAAIYSEVDWLPTKPQVVSIWSDEETSLIRLGKDQAMRVINHQINQLLPVFAQDMQQIVCNNAVLIESSELPINTGLDAAQCCAYLLKNRVINLYVDELKLTTGSDDSKKFNTLKVLGTLLVLSWLVIQGIQWFSLNQSISELKAQQSGLLRDKYADVAPAELMDPFAALQSRLKLQNTQTNPSRDILLHAVDYLGQATNQQKMVRLDGLRLIDQKLEIQIIAPSMTVINEFHQSLQQHAFDYNVQIGVNELSDDNTFKSILTMVPR